MTSLMVGAVFEIAWETVRTSRHRRCENRRSVLSLRHRRDERREWERRARRLERGAISIPNQIDGPFRRANDMAVIVLGTPD